MPSASPKAHARTQRRAEEVEQAPNDRASNKVTDYSEVTARHNPGSPACALVDGDQTKSALPPPKSGGKLTSEIELKAEVTVKQKNADLNVSAHSPLIPSSARSKNSKIGQVIFSK